MAYIRELPNGKYRVLWREHATDDFGAPIRGQYVQRSETVDTAKAAERRKVAIETEIDSGTDPSSKRDKAALPLGNYASRYFDASESTIGKVTHDRYRDIYRIDAEPGRVVRAEELFGDRREVWIELDGVRYRLRITRRGRLIRRVGTSLHRRSVHARIRFEGRDGREESSRRIRRSARCR